MSFETSLVTYIETNVTEAGKGFPLVVPQDENKPAWAYQMIPVTEEVLAHDGPTGLWKGRCQITVQAVETEDLDAYGAAKVTAEAIRSALHGFRGAMGDVIIDLIKCRSLDDEWAAQREIPVARLDLVMVWRP